VSLRAGLYRPIIICFLQQARRAAMTRPDHPVAIPHAPVSPPAGGSWLRARGALARASRFHPKRQTRLRQEAQTALRFRFLRSRLRLLL